MARRLVSLSRLVEDTEAEGLDLNQIFIDPDDVVELEEEQGEE